jgi:hypothetical protein
MPDDAAEFEQFTSQAMAEVAPAAAPVAEPAKVEPPADAPKVEPAKEPEPAKVEAAPEEKPPEVPAWKKAAEAEKAKRATKNAEAQLKAKLASVESELAEWREFKTLREKDPLAAAEKAKLSYDTLTKHYIKGLESGADPKPQRDPEVSALIQKIQDVEAQLKSQQQTIAQRAQSEWEQSFKAEVKSAIEAKGDALEFVAKHPQGPDLVREIRAAHYRDTATFDDAGNIIEPGEIMPTDEACKLAEEHLDKFLGHFKGAKKFSAAKEVPTQPAAKPAPAAPTLSQDMRQGGVTPNTPHGDEVEQLLLLKKTLEAQLNAQQG